MSKRPSDDMTAAGGWESFRAAVVPPDAGLIQRREMRRAFYAGVWHLFNIVRRGGEDDAITEDDLFVILERIKAECEQFNRDVQRGRA